MTTATKEQPTLEQLVTTARELANHLFASVDLTCTAQAHNLDLGRDAGPSCVQAEDERPLTRQEKKEGWARRPFWAYAASKMCPNCAAYYFAERAAQMLHEHHCWQVRIEAGNKAKQAQAVAD